MPDSFTASLAIFERLAQADPGNATWQRNLSVSYGEVGDVLLAQGDLAAATGDAVCRGESERSPC